MSNRQKPANIKFLKKPLCYYPHGEMYQMHTGSQTNVLQ